MFVSVDLRSLPALGTFSYVAFVNRFCKTGRREDSVLAGCDPVSLEGGGAFLAIWKDLINFRNVFNGLPDFDCFTLKMETRIPRNVGKQFTSQHDVFT